MFKGTSTNTGSGSYTPWTGLTSFNVTAVNPSKEQIEQLTGRDYPFEVNYDVRQMGDRNSRPVVFWLKSTEGNNIVERITFNMGMDDNKSMSGSVQFVNDKGQFKWANDEEMLATKYPDFKNAVRAKEGEQEFWTFIQRMTHYKPSSPDAQFMKDIIDTGLSTENIYKGDFSGLQDFVQYCQKKDAKIGLVLAVKEKQDGDTVKHRQTIITKPEAFFTIFDEVGDYHYKRLTDLVNEKEQQGYPLSNDLFTIKLQKFDKNAVVNNVPQNPQVAGGMTQGIKNDDLPF